MDLEKKLSGWMKNPHLWTLLADFVKLIGFNERSITEVVLITLVGCGWL